MDKKSRKWRRGLLIGLGIFAGIFILAVLFLSPYLKYLLEKNDEKWIGRQVKVSWVYANPLTGYVYLDEVKIFENKSDSVFLSLDGISLRFDLRKLLFKEYQINYLTLTRPIGTAIQLKKELFNFSDIVEKFSEKPEEKKKDTSRTKFSLMSIIIEDGTFYFREHITPVNYFIKDVNIRSSGLRWDVDTIANYFDFNAGIGSGKFEGHMTIDKRTALYKSHIIVRRLDLKIIEQYLKDLSRHAKFKALINLDITADGDLKDGRNINAVGGVGFYEFHFGRTESEDFASFKKFVIKINHLNPRKKIYEIDSISLVNPFVRYEKYDHLDNIQNMFGEKGSNVKQAASSDKFNLVIEIADYIRLLTRNFFHSNYKINRIGIYGADLQYHDYSLNERFALALNPLTIIADSLGSNKERVYLRLTSGVKPYGDLKLSLGINPRDSSDFELSYQLQKMNAAVLNPYLLAYTSFPLDRGSIDLKGNWRVRNGEIKSDNHLLVIDPRLTRRIRTNNNKWLPLKLVMFFARDHGNAIDYQIPISGNLKDPTFHLRDVLFDALSNVFIKPATTRYRFEIKDIENKIERTIGFNWEPGSAELLKEQEKFVKRVAKFLDQNPEAAISVFPIYYEEKEKEHIGFFEAKKKYFLLSREKSAADFSAKDSIEVSQLSPKDHQFNQFMRRHVNDSLIYTVQQRCRAFVGINSIDRKYDALNEARKARFLSYFIEQGVRDRLSFRKPESRPPFNGFSYYQVSYKGELPESMKEAFEDLREYDNEAPRKKLKEERTKTRKFFNSRKKE